MAQTFGVCVCRPVSDLVNVGQVADNVAPTSVSVSASCSRSSVVGFLEEGRLDSMRFKGLGVISTTYKQTSYMCHTEKAQLVGCGGT